MLFYTNILAKGNNVFFRGFKDGKRVSQKIDFKPSLYVKSNSKNTQYKSMWGEPLEKLNFDTISEAEEYALKFQKQISPETLASGEESVEVEELTLEEN